MKRVLLSVVLFTACLMILSLSVNADSGNSFGFKVSGGIAKMGGDATEDVEVANKFGFSFGAFYEMSLGDKFSLQPEILFVQKGVKKDGSFTDPLDHIYAWTEEAKFSYIQIPVLLKLNFPTKGKLKPNLFVGPSLAINLSAKSEGEWTEHWWVAPDFEPTWDEDIANVKSLDFSGIFGGGLSFMLGNTTLFFDVRYEMSFGTAFDDMTIGEVLEAEEAGETPFVLEDGTAEDLKHKSFMASLGIKIPIK